MKLMMLGYLIFLQSHVIAQINWDGGGADNLWSNPANWVGDLLPTSVDEVVLDNSIVANNYTVEFPAGNFSTVILKLLINPAAGREINLHIPISNLAPSALVLTGAGDALVLNKGAKLINSSGAASGTPITVGTDNFFRINDGGRYVHNTDKGHTNNLVARLSTAAGTEQGIFEFDVPGTSAYTISASNRTYGHLIFSAAASGTGKIYTASGISPFTINGDLEINSKATLTYGANTNIIEIKGDCLVKNEGTFNISNGDNNATILIRKHLFNNGTVTESGSSPASTLEFAGILQQHIYSDGKISQAVRVRINNSAGLLLQTAIEIPVELVLSNGKIYSSASTLLTMGENSSCVGGNQLSFVEGPMEKKGNAVFDFPIGLGEMYTPIGISGNGLITDRFRAQYFRTSPQSLHGNNLDPFFNHLSYVEYWRLTQENGNSAREVKMTVHPSSFARVFNTVYSSLFNNGVWNNLGREPAVQGPTVNINETGTIVSSSTNVFGDFSLATTDAVAVNPLPIRILDFTVQRVGNNIIEINWKIAEKLKPGNIIALQRSRDGNTFKTISEWRADDGRNENYRDLSAEKGKQYYRLMIIDPEMGVNYGNIIRTENEVREALTVYPNPINQELVTVRFSSTAKAKTGWQITDMTGRIVSAGEEEVTVGKNEFNINLSKIIPGNYVFQAMLPGNDRRVLKLVKL